MGQQKQRISQLAALNSQTLSRMSKAADRIEECLRVLNKGNGNLVGELLRGYPTFYEWDHYPEGDAVDWETHSQYYYHAHAAGKREAEHGHFHTFLRSEAIPSDLKPLPLDVPQKPNEDRIGAHLIGISMDPKGMPIKPF